MSIRNQIKELLDKPFKKDQLEAFKDAAKIQYKQEEELENFLHGVIASLYYKPNSKYLVIQGEQCFGKSTVARSLLPLEMLATYKEGELRDIQDCLFDYLLYNISEAPQSKLERSFFDSIITSHSFSVKKAFEKYPTVDKKLVSVMYTSSEPVLVQARRCCLITLKQPINFEELAKVDTLSMWREIYSHYKEHLI